MAGQTSPDAPTRPLLEISLILLFSLWLVVPGAIHLVGWNDTDDIARIEFRNPAPAPEVPSTLGDLVSFPNAATAYVDDHFGLRSQLATAHATMLGLVRQSSSEDVLWGQNGWLFFIRGSLMDLFRGTDRPDPVTMDEWIRSLDTVVETIRSDHCPLVLTLIPAKWSVHTRDLPTWARRDLRHASRYELLSARITRNGAPAFVNARESIRNLPLDGPHRVFRKTDTHWTTNATYATYFDLMEAVQGELPEVVPIPRTSFVELEKSPSIGDLGRFLRQPPTLTEPPIIRRAVQNPAYRLNRSWVTRNREWVEVEPFEAMQEAWNTVFESTGPNPLTVLVIADSFTIPMMDYLALTFHRTVFVRHRQLDIDRLVLDNVQPDLVLLNVNERAIGNRPRFADKPAGLPDLPWPDSEN